MTHFAEFRLKEKLMAWNGEIYVQRHWLAYYTILLWIHSICTLSACIHSHTHRETDIASNHSRWNVNARLLKRKVTKRMKNKKNEWMNEWTVNEISERKKRNISRTHYTITYTRKNQQQQHSVDHVVIWKLSIQTPRKHTKYYKMLKTW